MLGVCVHNMFCVNRPMMFDLQII